MTRPDRIAVVYAGIPAAGASIALTLGAPWVAGVLAGLAAAALALFWRVPHLDEDGNDIEALIKATREDMPDYVPAEWTEYTP